MGVQEISDHDWHNSSINSRVYWIVRARPYSLFLRLVPNAFDLAVFRPSLTKLFPRLSFRLLVSLYTSTLSFILIYRSPSLIFSRRRELEIVTQLFANFTQSHHCNFFLQVISRGEGEDYWKEFCEGKISKRLILD